MGSWKKHLKRVYEGITTDRTHLLIDGLSDGFHDQYEDAIEYFDRVSYLSVGNDDVKKDACYHKGIALSMIGKQDEAIATFKELSEMDENDSSVWFDLGIMYMGKEEYEKAVQYFNKSIKIEPNESTYWESKSDALLELEQFDEALKCVNKALKLDPKDIDGILTKCNILNGSNKSEEVIQLLEGSKYDDNISDIEYAKSVAYYNLGKIEKALECLDQSIQDESDNDVLWYDKARYLSRLDRKDDAIDALIVATSIDPENLMEMRDEEDFENIRKTERFKKLLSQSV